MKCFNEKFDLKINYIKSLLTVRENSQLGIKEQESIRMQGDSLK